MFCWQAMMLSRTFDRWGSIQYSTILCTARQPYECCAKSSTDWMISSMIGSMLSRYSVQRSSSPSSRASFAKMDRMEMDFWITWLPDEWYNAYDCQHIYQAISSAKVILSILPLWSLRQSRTFPLNVDIRLAISLLLSSSKAFWITRLVSKDAKHAK